MAVRLAAPDDVAAPPDKRTRAAAERKRLVAKGSDLTLIDGATVTVVYSARKLAQIEEDYGSLDAYWAAIGEGTAGKFFRHLAYTIGLVLGMSPDDAYDLIDTRRVREYMAAIAAALVEAMPEAEDDQGNAEAPGTTSSPGASSSTSPAPPSTTRRASSGT